MFALFNTLGTPNNLAIWDYVNEEKVPQVCRDRRVGCGAPTSRSTRSRSAGSPNYVTEAQIYADYLEKEKPSAKVAALFQNDGFGKDLLGGFEEATSAGIRGCDLRAGQTTHRPRHRRLRQLGPL